MQTNNILSAPLIDLVFDGRNKEYGAYELRNNYAKRINKALILTTVIAGLAFGGTALANSFKKTEQRMKISQDIDLSAIPEEKIEKLPEPEVEQPKPQEVQVKTIQYTTPVIVEVVENPPPAIEDMTNAKIDLKTNDGIDYTGISQPEVVVDTKQILEIKQKEVPDGIVDIVQIEAKYVGNWRAFLEKNLNPNVPVDNGAPAGTYQIVIQFVVDKEGNVSDIKALTNHGYGMEQEAMKVIKKSIKWEPGVQNGYMVKSYRRQPITFIVPEE